jgi:hypothetical protein
MATLLCGNCGAQLSRPIRIVQHSQQAPADLNVADGEPLTPAGTGVFSHFFFYIVTAQTIADAPVDFTTQHWLHPIDVLAAEVVTDTARLSGCCGLDGLNGPNMRCMACNEDVGTRQSDCWTADVFVPLPSATRWEESPDA